MARATSVVLMKDEEYIPFGNPPGHSEDAGFGALSTESGPLPLKKLTVRALISGLLYDLQVGQTFVNVHSRPLQATYIFPLPPRAAVSRFVLRVSGRVVEGILKERGEARREYNQAIARGHQAAIAEEDRPGVFTMRVGNIPPGAEAQVELHLQGPLAFIEGEATFRFPLVVAPRYIPGSPLPGDSVGDGVSADTDAVPDASRISPPVLLPGRKSRVTLDLEVTLDPSGLPFHGVRSSLHTTLLKEDSAGRLTLRAAPGERLNRDFVLRFRVGDEAVTTSLVLHPDEDKDQEGAFLLTLVPPAQTGSRRPRDVVFVLDRSGSMGGWKMVAARRAMANMVDTLSDSDRFQVLAFDDQIDALPGSRANQLRYGNDRERYSATQFLSGIEARGGTEMARPLRDAVTLLCSGDSGRDRLLVLVTDGQVGNEAQILRSLGEDLRQIRVFTLGIDRAVNEGFLRQLASAGGGGCEIVESEERLEEVMGRVHGQISTPVLTKLKLQERGFQIVSGSVTPRRLPDLFAEAPAMILGRYRGCRGEGSLTIRAEGGQNKAELVVEASTQENGAVRKIWARGHIRDLEDRMAVEGASPVIRQEILATSLAHTVLSKFTAFVAVDREERVNPGGAQHKVTQAVEQPDGWEGAALEQEMEEEEVDALFSESMANAAPAIPRRMAMAPSVMPRAPMAPGAARAASESSTMMAAPAPMAMDDLAQTPPQGMPMREQAAMAPAPTLTGGAPPSAMYVSPPEEVQRSMSVSPMSMPTPLPRSMPPTAKSVLIPLLLLVLLLLFGALIAYLLLRK